MSGARERLCAARLALPAALLAGVAHAACPPPFTGAGEATFFAGAVFGACALEFDEDQLVAAINGPQWDGSAHCGECLEVTGPLGTVSVKVVDRCFECLPGDLDLSPAAFSEIANLVDGRVPIAWRRVECPVSGAANFRFQSSNPFFLKLQVLDHRIGVAALDVRAAGSVGFTNLPRVEDNHFERSFASAVAFPLTVRATGTSGEPIEHTIPALESDIVLPGSSQFAACPPRIFVNGFEDAAAP